MMLLQAAHPAETQLRCLVPATDIGHVIGRKGETVQSMREKSGATIKVHEGNSGAALPNHPVTPPPSVISLIDPRRRVQLPLSFWMGPVCCDTSLCMTVSPPSCHSDITIPSSRQGLIRFNSQ